MTSSAERSIFKEVEEYTPLRGFEKINTPREIMLKCPEFLLDEPPENFELISSSVNAIKLGILADRGHVTQSAGDYSLGNITTQDVDPYSIADAIYVVDRKIFILDSSVIKLIGQPLDIFKGLPTKSEGEMNDWYSRALRLWVTFKGIDALKIQTKNKEVPLDSINGLDNSWDELGFPRIETKLRNTPRYDMYKMKALFDNDSEITRGFKPEPK